MEPLSVPELDPAFLPGGTVVGRWRVVAWVGRGVHGAVYRAVPMGQEHAPAVALKLAVLPDNPRFAREAALLSRLRHPSIPRLYDSGTWQVPGGGLHSFLALEWVDGSSLYDHSLAPRFSPRCVQVLAQLARALQQIHALGAVHRDIKGENILVRYSDGRALLMDFGSCHYPGAEMLTPAATYPGTPLYRAPESWSHELNRDRSLQPRAQAADDLFALGMTACRFLCGEYPRLSAPRRDEHGDWLVDAVRPPAELRDSRIDPRLRACILRLLSVRPQERGTAAELAEDLEKLVSPELEPSAAPRSPSKRRPPFALAAAVLLALGAGGMGTRLLAEVPALSCAGAKEASRSKVETTGLGEAVTATQAPDALHAPSGLTEEALPEPVPEQVRPDAKGRCPHKKQVALNGGCWLETPLDQENCEALTLSGHSGSRMFKNKCYVPVLSQPGRQPNTAPATTP